MGIVNAISQRRAEKILSFIKVSRKEVERMTY